MIAWVEKARHRLVAVCLAHYVARLFSTPTMEKLEAVSPDRDLALGLLADVEDLEASAPTLAMYELAHLGAVDAVAMEAFLDRFGHQGTSELDPGAPVWADDGDRVRRRVRELAASEPGRVLERRSSARAVAERRSAELAWPASLRLRIVAGACRAAGRLGERTKDNLARATHAIRRALQELARRADLDYEDAALLSWEELAQWVRVNRSQRNWRSVVPSSPRLAVCVHRSIGGPIPERRCPTRRLVTSCGASRRRPVSQPGGR